MSAEQILGTALHLVSGDRAVDYGPIWDNHENIAQLWSGYLYNKDEISAEDVANMMELLKIARRKTGVLKEDNYIDGAGYAAVAYECAAEEQARADNLSMLIDINQRLNQKLKEKSDDEKES